MVIDVIISGISSQAPIHILGGSFWITQQVSMVYISDTTIKQKLRVQCLSILLLHVTKEFHILFYNVIMTGVSCSLLIHEPAHILVSLIKVTQTFLGIPFTLSTCNQMSNIVLGRCTTRLANTQICCVLHKYIKETLL